MQWLNYHHLYYFYTIANEGGITEATKKLRLAQSTLSAQLKQLEEAVGYILFEEGTWQRVYCFTPISGERGAGEWHPHLPQ